MQKITRQFFQLLLWTLVAVGLVYLTFRDRSLADLLSAMRQADPFWVGMSAVALFFVLLFRAMRWKIMLESAGHPSTARNTMISTLICYLVNSLTPKLGEVVRCSVLLRTDKVPVAVSLGTVVSERVLDILILFGGLGMVIVLESKRLGGIFTQMAHQVSASLSPAGIAIISILMAGGLLIGWYVITHRYNNNNGLMYRVQTFARSTVESAKSVFSLNKPGLFILHTILIWIALVLMNYFFLLALPETQHLSVYYAFVLLFIGGLGWAMPVPGGIGTTHYLVLQVFLALGLSGAAGQDVGLLSNAATFIFTILYGIAGWIGYIPYFRPSAEANPASH
ncbi:MAG: lysylphosphatidylglycerol synthase transmembrane domain-containing protein [Bacteroidia bacterium]|nr:lysylphosphatidylglycerol synthase transmembrane domain-containing protein [Bacteroidia bacterium]